MTFHGSEFYFINWILFSMKMYHSSLKFPSQMFLNGSSCNIHPLKIHKWYSMDIWIVLECMDELQWDNGWPRWNQILIQLRVIIIESWWTSNGWCVSEWHWFIPIHVVYGSKWATITLKTQQPNFFPCFWWIIMCFMKEEKHSLEWEIEKDLDKKEREDKFLEF